MKFGYRPCIDSLALDYFCEDLGLLRDQSIGAGNTVNSEKAPPRNNKLYTAAFTCCDRLQRFIKRFSQHKPYQTRFNLARSIGIVRSALSIFLRDREEQSVETIAKLLLACSKIIFCEAEIRNLSHSKHNDINIFWSYSINSKRSDLFARWNW